MNEAPSTIVSEAVQTQRANLRHALEQRLKVALELREDLVRTHLETVFRDGNADLEYARLTLGDTVILVYYTLEPRVTTSWWTHEADTLELILEAWQRTTQGNETQLELRVAPFGNLLELLNLLESNPNRVTDPARLEGVTERFVQHEPLRFMPREESAAPEPTGNLEVRDDLEPVTPTSD